MSSGYYDNLKSIFVTCESTLGGSLDGRVVKDVATDCMLSLSTA